MTVGIDAGRDHLMYHNAHIIRSAGGKLRWVGITIEYSRSRFRPTAQSYIERPISL